MAFSDDDLMPSDAVERVMKTWKKSGECDAVFRFPLAIVDSYGKLNILIRLLRQKGFLAMIFIG